MEKVGELLIRIIFYYLLLDLQQIIDENDDDERLEFEKVANEFAKEFLASFGNWTTDFVHAIWSIDHGDVVNGILYLKSATTGGASFPGASFSGASFPGQDGIYAAILNRCKSISPAAKRFFDTESKE